MVLRMNSFSLLNSSVKVEQNFKIDLFAFFSSRFGILLTKSHMCVAMDEIYIVVTYESHPWTNELPKEIVLNHLMKLDKPIKLKKI